MRVARVAAVTLAALLGTSAGALAACPNPITVKDAAGATQNFNTTVDAGGNCASNTAIVDGTAAANKLAITAAGAAKVDGSGVTQPVSGTVTVNGTVTANEGGAPWSVNETQIGGTAVDTNSGVKSAGTQRVVLATDQPALTNALKVDPSGVTSPVSQSGTWTLRLTGNAGAAMDAAGQNAASPANELLTGCQFNTSPTTISTGNMSPVQCTSAGSVLVHADGTVAISAASLPLPTGASTAAKQPALGTAGTASADVISIQGIASMTAVKVDGSAVTQPVSGTVTANQGATWTVQPGNTANTTPWLTTINDGTNSAKVQAASTRPAAADKALTVQLSPNPPTYCPSVKSVNITASTDLVTSVNKLYICRIDLVIAGQEQVSIVEGTGATCATGVAALWGATTADATHGMPFAANGGIAIASMPPVPTQTGADHLCILKSGANLLSGAIWYADAS